MDEPEGWECMNWFERVLVCVRAIPPGKVATYGDIARMAGNPRGARQVGWVLGGLTEEQQAPWWRVVNREGRSSLEEPGRSRQWQLLQSEGTAVHAEGAVDLAACRWNGE